MLETLKSCLLRVGGCLSTTAVFLLLLLFFVFLVFLVWFGFQGRVASSRLYGAGEQKPCWSVPDNRSADSQCSRKAKHLLPSLSLPLIPHQPASSLGTLSPTVRAEVPPSQQIGNWKYVENKIPAPVLIYTKTPFCVTVPQQDRGTVSQCPHWFQHCDVTCNLGMTQCTREKPHRLHVNSKCIKGTWTSRWISVLSSPSFLSFIPCT